MKKIKLTHRELMFILRAIRIKDAIDDTDNKELINKITKMGVEALTKEAVMEFR